MSLFKKAALGVAVSVIAANAFAAAAKPKPVVVFPAPLYAGGATLPAIAYVGSSWLNINTAPTTASANNYGTGAVRQSVTTGEYTLAGTTTSATANTGAVVNLFTPPAGVTGVLSWDVAGNSSATPATVGAGQAIADKTSLFGAFAASGTAKAPTPDISYCQTGSGTGRKTLYGLSGFVASNACTDYSASSKGFGAPAGVDLAFSASDAPLNATEYAAFLTNRTAKVEPVQIPAVAGAIAVIYNPGTSGATGQVILTESQICQIFAGQITNWSQLGAYASQPITLVYRSDDSGTSFNFTNHLSAVCPTAIPNAVSTFVTASNYAATTGGNTVPTSAVGASGNGGVVNTVLATAGAIGYAEVADALARANVAGGSGLYYAAVKLQNDVPATVKYVPTAGNTAVCNPATGPKSATCTAVKVAAQKFKALDPVKDFPKAVTVTWTADQTIASYAAGRPVLGAVTLPATGAKAGCLNIVDPNTIAIPALAKGDYSQYPIEAVSYLLGFEAGNGTAAPYVQSLFDLTGKLPSAVKTIGKGTGYAALTSKIVGNGNGTTVKAVVAACVNS